MKYIKVEWKHVFLHEPIYLYSELDRDLNEIRKVEIFRDNTFGFAYGNYEYNGTRLSIQPLPSIEEIDLDEQLVTTILNREEFDSIWDLYTGNSESIKYLTRI